jgi:hypothetical protein
MRFPIGKRKSTMALALLCMTMFVLLTTASMRATRREARQSAIAASPRGKWIRTHREA